MNNLSSFYGNRYLFPLWVVTFLLYLAMNLSLSWFARWLARRGGTGSRHGKGGGTPGPVDPTQGLLVTEARAEAQEARGPA